MNFYDVQCDRMVNLLKNTDVFNGDVGGGVYMGKPCSFALQDAKNNLFVQYSSAIINYLIRRISSDPFVRH